MNIPSIMSQYETVDTMGLDRNKKKLQKVTNFCEKNITRDSPAQCGIYLIR
jgi:hypothetical protein